MYIMEYILWIIFMVAMLIVEASTVNLVSIWFAIGALGAIIAAYFGGGLICQLVVFVAVTAVSLLIAKPFIKKFRNTKTVATNADRLIGETGIVTEEIDNTKFAGRVTVNGSHWAAVAGNKEEISIGTKVRIKEISGVKLIVEKED
ncbi:MAG: NfeD family protein [Ruminococcaceae bacterium]|nr:NfeD family protein [Oscillospiraceae bacterium]